MCLVANRRSYKTDIDALSAIFQQSEKLLRKYDRTGLQVKYSYFLHAFIRGMNGCIHFILLLNVVWLVKFTGAKII